MPGVMFWFFCILTKETHMPLISCQSKCRTLLLKLSRERCFPRKRESNHQMKSCQILTPEVLNSCLTHDSTTTRCLITILLPGGQPVFCGTFLPAYAPIHLYSK